MCKIGNLVAQIANLKMPAVALADRGNLYGLIKFYNACWKKGIQPLVACDLVVLPEAIGEDQLPPGNLLLLARNRTGYQNLLKLVTDAHLQDIDGKREKDINAKRAIPEAWFDAHSEGLLVLSGGREGTLGKLLLQEKLDLARAYLERCQSRWSDALYLEVQRTGRQGDEDCLRQTLILANQTSIPVVATHDVCFLAPEDFEIHETRICINEGWKLDDTKRPRYHSEQQYMKSSQEMAVLFADLPDALLLNTLEIAKRCSFRFTGEGYHLPKYQVPEGETEEQLLARLAEQKLQHYCDSTGIPEQKSESKQPSGVKGNGQSNTSESADDSKIARTMDRSDYFERLHFELKIINEMQFAGYFLIVMEFVNWAKEQSIPVGPGRGSGAGSLVAYMLGITDLDPLKYGLLFERFLNPERKSMPDFDIDFCIEGRDKVIAHVAELYGRDAVSQIITLGTSAAKGIVRDVVRVQGKAFGFGDKLAKMIPAELDITLEEAMKDQVLSNFVKEDEDAAEVMKVARKLEGVARAVGKHPGGIVIAPGPLSDYLPLTKDENNAVLTQFDKDDVESVGLVKFDFLGLRTLTIIDQAVRVINESHAADFTDGKLCISDIPLDDPKVFELLRQAETTALFQLESRAMRDLIRKFHPIEFEDIVALLALIRPGPTGMLDTFIKRRHGQARVDYPHPSLEPVLKGTYGVILYQEQVMQIAQILAGYTLGDADMLRRAMGKKDAVGMDEQREQFLAGAMERDVERSTAQDVFKLIKKFAHYGFNRSHSVGYALVSYQTAWLKAHYPAEFMAAALSAEMHNTDKIMRLLAACKAMGLSLSLPDLNQSGYRFTVTEKTCISYGLGAIKGVGAGFVESCVAGREANGPYQDLFDFCMRHNQDRTTNKGTIEALIKSGACDSLAPMDTKGKPHRAAMLVYLKGAMEAAGQRAQRENEGLTDMFEDLADVPIVKQNPEQIAPWSMRSILEAEHQALGLYLSGHPVDLYRNELKSYAPGCISNLNLSKGRRTIGGLVVAIRKVYPKNKTGSKTGGNPLAFLSLEDASGRMEVVLRAKLFEQHQEWLQKNHIVIVSGKLEADNHTDGLRMLADSIRSIPMARVALTDGVWLELDGSEYAEGKASDEMLAALGDVLDTHRKSSGCPVTVRYSSGGAQADIVLGEDWKVVPSDEFLLATRALFGEDRVHLGSPGTKSSAPAGR